MNDLLATLGSVIDGIQLALDKIQEDLGLPLLFNNPPRVNAYASVMRKLFFALRARFEWLTIQVKCLSRGDVTLSHKDKSNCPSHDTTAALCFVVKDTRNTLWSVKFLVNSRAVVGTYMDKTLSISPSLLSACEGYLSTIDEAYSMFSSGYAAPSLTWKTFEDFFLDNDCEWERDVATNLEQIKLPTALSRNFWMSPAVHRLEQCQERMPRKALLEMLLLSSYQSSWSRYWATTKTMLSSDLSTDDKADLTTHPSKLFCRLSKQSFKSWIGGPNPRFVPPGIDFEKLYFGSESANNLDKVIGVLEQFIEWIETVDPLSLTDHDRKTQFKKFSDLFSRECRCEIGEFRLQLIAELLVLTGLVENGLEVAQRVYPVKEKGSYKHLMQNGVPEEKMIPTMEMLGTKLGLHCLAHLENLCCESYPERKDAWDVFFKGMNLYLIRRSSSGASRVYKKKYGQKQWE
jgi:hypothetical protein